MSGASPESRLAAVDAALDARGPRQTLAPDRARARTLSELLLGVGPRCASSALAARLAGGLATIAETFADDFPENVFWDLDRLAATLAAAPDEAALDAQLARLAALSCAFGRRSSIRFRYLHDFLYGFDWCRWVAKAPEVRHAVGPFDPELLGYLTLRARELEALIAADDAKYGRLADTTSWRNPFAFSREPDDEARLHLTLAARDLLPVRAWTFDDDGRWRRPYAALRTAVADELGVPRRPDEPSASTLEGRA
jgi:hypothetical protein